MNDLMKHQGEVLRALATHQYEVTEEGGILLLAGINATPMGIFDVEHRRKGKLVERVMGSNVIPAAALNDILAVYLGGGTQKLSWYIALFEGNYTPTSALTAANFASTATECTTYDEASRVLYEPAAPSGGVLDNAAARALFTMNATKTVYGGALISVATKGATTGVLAAAARFPLPRNVVDDDELSVRYSVTMTSEP